MGLAALVSFSNHFSSQGGTLFPLSGLRWWPSCSSFKTQALSLWLNNTMARWTSQSCLHNSVIPRHCGWWSTRYSYFPRIAALQYRTTLWVQLSVLVSPTMRNSDIREGGQGRLIVCLQHLTRHLLIAPNHPNTALHHLLPLPVLCFLLSLLFESKHGEQSA